MVGVAGFEPTTPCPPDKCANRAALHSDWRPYSEAARAGNAWPSRAGQFEQPFAFLDLGQRLAQDRAVPLRPARDHAGPWIRRRRGSTGPGSTRPGAVVSGARPAAIVGGLEGGERPAAVGKNIGGASGSGTVERGAGYRLGAQREAAPAAPRSGVGARRRSPPRRHVP